MKIQIVIILILSALLSCTEKKSLNDRFIVTKINSINDVYIIYAVKNDSIFKIVSSKNKEVKRGKCEKITMNKSYNFKLKSLIDWSITPINVEGVMYQNEVIKFERDSINDIFTTTNLNGLCYLKKNR